MRWNGPVLILEWLGCYKGQAATDCSGDSQAFFYDGGL